MRVFRSFFAVIALGVCAFSTAQAQRSWRQIHRDAALNVALDTTRITRNADRSYTIVLRWNYASPRTAENQGKYTRMIQQVQVMCGGTIRVKRFAHALYSSNGQLVEEARPLPPGQLRYMDWDVPRAQSEGARVYPGVCRALTARTRPST